MTDVEKILKAILGPDVPAVLLVLALVLLLWKHLKEPILDVVGLFRWVWRIRKVGLKQSREDVERAKRRAAFAREMRSRVLDLGEQQGYDDARFADVDLTVAVGDLTSHWWRRGFSGGRRRERSLARVLDHSDKTILRLQGDPGSGKSVALRHLTAVMGDRAARKPRLGWHIPVYFDLSLLRPAADAGTSVTPTHIETFVNEQLRARQLGSAKDTLQQVWEEGLEDGAWIFLFDSFDEIPAVLTATEDDDPMVREYWTAITGYIDGPHECRGVVASRGFRTPTSSRWPVLDIQRLSSRRQADLVRQSGLDADAQQTCSTSSRRRRRTFRRWLRRLCFSRCCATTWTARARCRRASLERMKPTCRGASSGTPTACDGATASLKRRSGQPRSGSAMRCPP
jgi:hypothetical protein